MKSYKGGKLYRMFQPVAVSTLASYSQVFFSLSRVFALVLLVVSFLSVNAGMGGLWGVLSANGVAWAIGLNRQKILSGLYGFNSLLTSLALSVMFAFTPSLLAVIFFTSVLCLFITVSIEGVFYKYGLSYLSLPFLVSVWILTLSSRTLTELDIHPGGAFLMNEMYRLGGLPLVSTYQWFSGLNLPDAVTLYFRSLGAIFFQYSLFAGICIALGLIYYSRIVFVLSVLGFAAAWGFYKLLGGNLTELTYGYIGFNFILTAIAVGGFFTIASPYTFFWVVLLSPLISFIISSGSAVLAPFQLPVYSLPFNMVVLMFLYVLKFRERHFDKPYMVAVQLFSPEKNLYSRMNYDFRFGHPTGFYFSLPFYGEWVVTQGHDGKYTHREEWRHAWDFEISDDQGKTFSGEGFECQDYYCFGKPVLAPADGWVTEVVNEVADNPAGGMNQAQNWGNTLVLKHGEGLYSKLSHLQTGSVKVGRGDYVSRGQVVARAGNSGRSPYPHLHFQIQTSPYIGSPTFRHPLSNYLTSGQKEKKTYVFSGIPGEGERVENIQPRAIIEKAFRFVPGQTLKVMSDKAGGDTSVQTWEVISDMHNQTCIYNAADGSKAWFLYAQGIFYFTAFEGDYRSALYSFFLAHYKVIPG